MLSQFRAQAPWSRVETVLPLLRPVGCPLLIQHPQCSPPRIQIVSPQSWPFQRWCVLPFPLLFPDKFRPTCSPGLCTCCFPSPGWPQPSPLSLGERTGLRHSDKYHFFLTTASSQLPKLRIAQTDRVTRLKPEVSWEGLYLKGSKHKGEVKWSQRVGQCERKWCCIVT